MPKLTFQIVGASRAELALAPQLNFRLRVQNAPAEEQIQSVLLNCQVRIESTLRRYGADEQAGLGELFGEPARWATTLKSLLWTHAAAQVPAFSGSTEFDLPIPCTFDFNVAATKYFGALQTGDVPLLFLFSGTIFYAGADGALQIARVPWTQEALFRLPVQTWKEMMEHHYADRAVLDLRRDLLDRLRAVKNARGLQNLDDALEQLLAERAP